MINSLSKGKNSLIDSSRERDDSNWKITGKDCFVYDSSGFSLDQEVASTTALQMEIFVLKGKVSYLLGSLGSHIMQSHNMA